MSVEQVQAAQRLLIHDLGELRRAASRAMDKAQLGEKPDLMDDLEDRWSRVQRARLTVIEAMREHDGRQYVAPGEEAPRPHGYL